ncbi:MAG: S9 family peptidase [Flavipsychrobacter sp.]|nr:S9 family peptidase [Flavipsychrobacter sp.]
MRKVLFSFLLLSAINGYAQDKMTPELLWKLKRIAPIGLSPDGKSVYYGSRQYDMKTEKGSTANYAISLATGQRSALSLPAGKNIFQRSGRTYYATGGNSVYVSRDAGKSWSVLYSGLSGADNISVSPNGKYIAFSREVLVKKVMGTDLHPDLPKTTAQVYTDLNYRHWDTWEDGKFSHIFVVSVSGKKPVDIMEGEPYDCPQKPFGGAEDFVWNPNSNGLVYVCKKKFGREYATSTNTDLYYYDLSSGETTNWTSGMMGYDMSPSFSPDGSKVAWTSMARDGYEADKVDLFVMDLASGVQRNLTRNWDETAGGFQWAKESNELYFVAAWRGTEQLFAVNVPANLNTRSATVVERITDGKFDVNGIVGQSGNQLVVTRTDMNHAAELYSVDLNDGSMRQLSHENDNAYSKIKLSRTELRMVRTTDGKQMGVWVIYPPDFNPAKKYPTLLYCQGGPQSALSQFYSFRWNFQLMAANGYIVVAPNRRGMPGWGTRWNEDISGDWGGQPMRDYLSAIDAVAKEDYVDKDRLGCVGASYGGYSVFMLAGIHNGRFKSFISHDGLFDLKSWYGTTEELWFANWDIGGPYWGRNVPASYERFNPSNYVDRWNTPIMIVQGGTDYRVAIEQGLEAFQAAKLKGLKSKLLYLPNENHWVLHPQNAMVWQREFYSWLKETL